MSETPSTPDLEPIGGDELRDRLRYAELPTAGRVDEIRDRLRAHYEAHPEAAQLYDERAEGAPTADDAAADSDTAQEGAENDVEADAPDADPEGPDDEPVATEPEEIKTWRANYALTSLDGRDLIPAGKLFQAPESDGRTKSATEVKPDAPTAEQAAALEAAADA